MVPSCPARQRAERRDRGGQPYALCPGKPRRAGPLSFGSGGFRFVHGDPCAAGSHGGLWGQVLPAGTKERKRLYRRQTALYPQQGAVRHGEGRRVLSGGYLCGGRALPEDHAGGGYLRPGHSGKRKEYGPAGRGHPGHYGGYLRESGCGHRHPQRGGPPGGEKRL